MAADPVFTDRLAKADLAAKNLKARSALAGLRKDGAPPAASGGSAGDLGSPDLAAGGGAKVPQQGSDRRSVVHSKVDFQGIPVHIDRPRGTVHKGQDAKGKDWVRVYHVDYGYIPNTRGGDEHNPAVGKDGQLDVYLGLYPEAKDAHWVLQQKEGPLGEPVFDEYKLMLGYPDADVAKAMYLVHTPKRFFGSMASTSVEMVKALLGLRPAEVMKVLKGLAGVAPEGLSGEELAAAAEAVSALKSVERVVPFKIAKDASGGELRYLLGFVLEPDVVDAQGDTYDADEVRKAAWGYMAHFRNVGLMHKGLVNGKVDLVESYVAPVDMEVAGSAVRKGTWMLGLRVNDDGLWEDVRKGKLTGLSIGGFAKKEALA